MCDASDFAIGVILGQREDGKPYVVYYASKTLNEAQRNYITQKGTASNSLCLRQIPSILGGVIHCYFYRPLYFEVPFD